MYSRPSIYTYFLYPLYQARNVHHMICDAVRKSLYSALNYRSCVRFLFFWYRRTKVHSFVPKKRQNLEKNLRNDDDLSYNNARQAESRGIAQTMESRARYGTHTKLQGCPVHVTDADHCCAVPTIRADG